MILDVDRKRKVFLPNGIDKEEKNLLSISDFYKGTSIFITGVSGFVGKSLLEKLLISFKEIEKIYVLVRAKNGKKSQERLEKILDSPIFCRVKEKSPNLLSKVIALEGECGLDNLGLTNQDEDTLINNVQVVFHSAASVKFNEPLEDAIKVNTYGTKTMLEICKKMKKIKGFVYVSTIFCNSDKMDEKIEEIIYKSKYDVDEILTCIKTLPSYMIRNIETQLIGKHPNSYTFSKFLAENVILKYKEQLQVPIIVIVRPSIIIAAVKDPYPGWTDSRTGVTGIMSESGKGSLTSVYCKGSLTADLIPIDILINTLITSVWYDYHNNKSNTDADVKVYHCTSGKRKIITWNILTEHMIHFVRKYPSVHTIWYPSLKVTSNKIIHFLYVYQHYFVTFIIEWYYYFFGKQNFYFLNYYKKTLALTGMVKFFITHQFDFAQDRIQTLIENVKKDPDGEKFDMDVREIELEKYFENYVLGIRKYLFRDNLSTLPKAKQTFKKLYWIKLMVKICVSCFVLMAIWYEYFSLRVA